MKRTEREHILYATAAVTSSHTIPIEWTGAITTIQGKEWYTTVASMAVSVIDLQEIIRQLQAQKQQIEAAIGDLEQLQRKHEGQRKNEGRVLRLRPPRNTMGPEERRRVSDRLKANWQPAVNIKDGQLPLHKLHVVGKQTGAKYFSAESTMRNLANPFPPVPAA